MVVGTQVGAYKILSELGAGGMGSVWLAEHAMIGRRAAIKMLHAEYSRREEVVTRFFNEARAATAIADPGIVQVFDFGYHTDGTAYLVMELLEGEALDKRLTRVGALGPAPAMRIMRQVATTLGAAHVSNVVHRDLKPENVFLVKDPEVAGGERAKVLDFGIAKLVGDKAGPKTQTTAVIGTPMYMSPEQCRGAGQVDQRSDVYSMGCMLFALITGRPPFDAPGVGDIIAMHLREPAPLASSLVPSVPKEVDALIARCLAKDPNQRYSGGTDLACAIEEVIMSPGMARVNFPTLPNAQVPRGPSTTLHNAASEIQRTTQHQVRAKKTFAFVLGSVVIAAVVIAVVASRGGDDAAPSTAAAAPAPVAAPAPAPAPATAPDAKAATAATMRRALADFSTWAKLHPSSACPTSADLGSAKDGWGHALTVTCTDQPADQIIGLVSAGADGTAGNSDDVTSWSFGDDVVAAVKGPRWHAEAVAAAPASPRVRHRPRLPRRAPRHLPRLRNRRRSISTATAFRTSVELLVGPCKSRQLTSRGWRPRSRSPRRFPRAPSRMPPRPRKPRSCSTTASS
jgi:tRNA A-37 threonylcarbamoyl transferase component Bud32